MAWNDTDFTGQTFADSTFGLLEQFTRAYNERASVHAISTFGAYTPYVPLVGQRLFKSVLLGGADGPWARVLYPRVDAFVPKRLADGTLYSPEGDTVLRNCARDVKRWFRRQIYTTTQPGTAGQRARFRSFTGDDSAFGVGRYRQIESTNPLWGTYPTTPTGERKYSGLYLDHNGTTWVLSADQVTTADEVEELIPTTTNVFTGAPQIPYFMQEGDLIHNKWFQQWRDLYNVATRPIGQFSSATASSFTHLESAFKFTATLEGFSRSGSGSSPAGAIAAYDAATTNPSSGASASATRGSPTSYTTSRNAGSFKNTSVMPNHYGLARDVTFWFIGGPSGTFAAFGDDVLNGQWHQVGGTTTGVTSTAAGTVTGPLVGTMPAVGNAPASFPATNGSNGWGAAQIAIMLDFETTGGFTLTESTPP